MIQDPHSNSVALVTPLRSATELQIVCTFRIEHAPGDGAELALSPSALIFPLPIRWRSASTWSTTCARCTTTPTVCSPTGPAVHAHRRPTGTRQLLLQMNGFIREHFGYAARDEEGTQSPLQTLQLGTGSCRDFALLMMEAVRRLGMAARFVSGYLYDPALDPAAQASGKPVTLGAGSTHAWLQVYLPGAGWVPFDPTNNLRAGTAQLIRVGVARDPSRPHRSAAAGTARPMPTWA